jgi:DNA mismatch endonuclease, patch repair protein
MADIVDASTRSRMMAGIRSKNTKHELEIRKKLFALGFRYRLHDQRLPGKPDIVLPRYRAVIFFNGCFWHAHGCFLFKWPSSRVEFWKQKLTANKENDRKKRETLISLGWRILTIWECSFRGPGKDRDKEIDEILIKTIKWLESKKTIAEIQD